MPPNPVVESIVERVVTALRFVINAYTIAIFITVLFSWFTIGGQGHPSVHRFYELLSKITEPLLGPIREVLSPVSMRIGLDFSPIIALLILQFIARLLQ